MAGLRRLDLVNRTTTALSPEIMLPAVAQGVIGILCRQNDSRTYNLLQPLNHLPTAICVKVERTFSATLNGNCRIPIAGLAELLNTGNALSPNKALVRFRCLAVNDESTPVFLDCFTKEMYANNIAIQSANLIKSDIY